MPLASKTEMMLDSISSNQIKKSLQSSKMNKIIHSINITDLVLWKDSEYRITHFKKRVEDNFPNNPYNLLPFKPLNPNDVVDSLILEVLEEELSKEKLKRKELGLPHTKRYRFQHCRKEEATHVSLYALTYPIAPIEQVVFQNKIPWSQELIIVHKKKH